MAPAARALLLAAGLVGLRAAAPPCADGACAAPGAYVSLSEAEIEELEVDEARVLRMELLQTKLETAQAAHVAAASATASEHGAAAAHATAASEHGAQGVAAAPRHSLATAAAAPAAPAAPAATAVELGRAEAMQVEGAPRYLSPEVLQAALPVVAITVGLALVQTSMRTAGLLCIYFGVQTGLNIYMKAVLSGAVVSSERHMKGIPGAFLITAIQQLVSFAMLIPVLAILWPTRWRYTPKPLTSIRACAWVLGLSTTFALNIGLNNLCLSLLPMSINLMLRSCIPLATWLMQTLLSTILPGRVNADGSTMMEISLMLAGVFFAGLASVAKEEGAGKSEEAANMGLGLIIGGLSLVACSLYLIVAQWLGKDAKLNPLDMTLYMSVPAAVFLMPFIFLMPHPVGWKGHGAMTDFEVLKEVLSLSPSVLWLVALSGFFAILYNTLQYTMVSELSATHTAFAGNFNKAATIVMSLALGMEALPPAPWGQVTVFAIFGGISSFTAYSVVRASSGGKAGH